MIVRKDTLGTRNSITSTTSEKILLHFFTSKARLHLQFLLRFLVRFSSSDECERVDELWLPPISMGLLGYTYTQNINSSSTRSHASEGENRTRNRSKNFKCKRAFRTD